MDPVFVQASGLYPAYNDFYELVRLSGFGVTKADMKVNFQAGNTYIWSTLDGEMMHALSELDRSSSKHIFWHLERPDANLRSGMDPVETFRKGNEEILEFVDAIWVPDRALQRLDPLTTHAVLGSHPGMKKAIKSNRDFDVVHMGQETPRRRAVIDQVKASGHSFVAASWGDQRERALVDSKLMLSLDRVAGMKVASTLRWAVAAAYSLPIVSEEVSDPYPLAHGSLIQAPYERLAMAVDVALSTDAASLRGFGVEAHEILCRDWTFRKGVSDALARTF